MPLKCQCGDVLDDKRAARGHMKFKNDETHGDQFEIPDDWESFFEEVEEGNADADGSGDGSSDDGSESSSDSRDKPDPDTGSSETDSSDDSPGGLSRLLNADLRELISE